MAAGQGNVGMIRCPCRGNRCRFAKDWPASTGLVQDRERRSRKRVKIQAKTWRRADRRNCFGSGYNTSQFRRFAQPFCEFSARLAENTSTIGRSARRNGLKVRQQGVRIGAQLRRKPSIFLGHRPPLAVSRSCPGFGMRPWGRSVWCAPLGANGCLLLPWRGQGSGLWARDRAGPALADARPSPCVDLQHSPAPIGPIPGLWPSIDSSRRLIGSGADGLQSEAGAGATRQTRVTVLQGVCFQGVELGMGPVQRPRPRGATATSSGFEAQGKSR